MPRSSKTRVSPARASSSFPVNRWPQRTKVFMAVNSCRGNEAWVFYHAGRPGSTPERRRSTIPASATGGQPMKIARIETFILGTGSAKDLLFCRVETEDGLYGWGEAYVTQGKEKVVAECIQAMAPHVIGRSAFNIRHTGQVMYEDFAIKRGSPELLAAWSAVEIASWDILGKRAGLPVYNLIGGASRERVRVYANGWSRGSTIEERVERGLQ